MNNASMKTSVGEPLSFAPKPRMARVAPIALAICVHSGCDKADSKKTPSTLSSPTTQAESLPSAAPVAPAAPADMDVSALEKDLNCAKTGPKQACRVVKEFALAQRYTARTPSGEGRWIGRAFVVEKGVETEREIILWAKVVPTSQVGPGDLPIKVGYDFFPDELKTHAEKLVRTLGRGDSPSPMNQAFPYAKAFVPAKQRAMVNTAGQSVHVTSEESVYLRAKQPRLVYLVNTASGSAAPGDGMYAELWLADW